MCSSDLPAWLVRLGLFFYDHLGGRKILPATKTLNLAKHATGAPLKEGFARGFEYSDCWVEDSRLVALNARDAVDRGATVMTRSKVVSARRDGDFWRIEVEDRTTGEVSVHRARMVINAGGPWVGHLIRNVAGINSRESVRLVRGSHIVTRKLFDHDKCYFFQGPDGRIIFAIPYERDFTLVGTTYQGFEGDPSGIDISPEEATYLCDAANEYLRTDIAPEDAVSSYAGVRPLYDDGASSATAATRDYTLKVDNAGGAPILNVFGGKITTYRKLAEDAMDKIVPFFPGTSGNWTAGVALPGGDFAVDGFDVLVTRLREDFRFLTTFWARRLVRAYGTEAGDVMAGAETEADMGRAFGATLTEREVRWLQKNEYARTAEDVVWRRNKLGLRLTKEEIADLEAFMQGDPAERKAKAAE